VAQILTTPTSLTSTDEDDELPLTPAQQKAIDKGWSLPGFEMVTAPPHPRLVISIWGGEKTGKTTFATTFPEPILFHNFDYSLDELLIKRPELLGRIGQAKFPVTETMIARELEPILDSFTSRFGTAIEYLAKHGGSLAVDTTTQLWQIVQDVLVTQVRDERVRVAEAKKYDTDRKRDDAIERASKPMQLDYGKANMFMAALLRRPLHHDKINACFIAKAKPAYNSDTGKPTGSMEFHGFGETPGITQAHLQFFRRVDAQARLRHFARIDRCRYDSSLEGLDLLEPTYEIIRDMMLGSTE
jgi:hypothetical protein